MWAPSGDHAGWVSRPADGTVSVRLTLLLPPASIAQISPWLEA